jgi:hypothetical protein
MVSCKTRVVTATTVPLLVSRNWLEENLDVGGTTIAEMERDGRLKVVALPGVRGKRYEGAAVVRMLGLLKEISKTA